ncbi:hypothetical protein KCU65_g6186, partial [Aureobasidium melanogenum]
MPLTLTSIVLTCITTSHTLDHVNSTLVEYSGTVRDPTQGVFEQFEGIKIGCTMTLSLLERHVLHLLDAAGSEMPLKAQKASRTDKLKALYKESDMKVLFGQLKDYNALLNTMLNQLHSNKQDRMIDMMTNQEQTLGTMLQAQDSLRRFLENGPVGKETDAASILSSTTSVTAFDFDSIIKATAVYKRVVSSVPPDRLREPHQPSAASHNEIEDASRNQSLPDLPAHNRTRSASQGRINMQHKFGDFIEYKPDTTPTNELRRRSYRSVRKDNPLNPPVEDRARSASPKRIKQKVTEKLMQRQREEAIEYEPETKSRGDRRRSSRFTRKDDLLDVPVEDRTRSASQDRIKQKVMEKLMQRQLEAPIKYEPDTETTNERRPHSSCSTRKNDLDNATGSTMTYAFDTIPKVDLNNPKLLQTIEDSIRLLILPELTQSTNAQPRSSDVLFTDNELDQGTPRTLTRGESLQSRSSKNKESYRLAKTATADNAGGELTVAALRYHDSQYNISRERRKKRKETRSPIVLESTSSSCSLTTEHTVGVYSISTKAKMAARAAAGMEGTRPNCQKSYRKQDIPPMPWTAEWSKNRITRI